MAQGIYFIIWRGLWTCGWRMGRGRKIWLDGLMQMEVKACDNRLCLFYQRWRCLVDLEEARANHALNNQRQVHMPPKKLYGCTHLFLRFLVTLWRQQCSSLMTNQPSQSPKTINIMCAQSTLISDTILFAGSLKMAQFVWFIVSQRIYWWVHFLNYFQVQRQNILFLNWDFVPLEGEYRIVNCHAVCVICTACNGVLPHSFAFGLLLYMCYVFSQLISHELIYIWCVLSTTVWPFHL
jgi:hypothetical protein